SLIIVGISVAGTSWSVSGTIGECMYENENRVIVVGRLRVHTRHRGMPCKSNRRECRRGRWKCNDKRERNANNDNQPARQPGDYQLAEFLNWVRRNYALHTTIGVIVGVESRYFREPVSDLRKFASEWPCDGR